MRRRYGTQPRYQAPEGSVGRLTGQRRQERPAAAPHWATLAAAAAALALVAGIAVCSAVFSCNRHQSKRYEVRSPRGACPWAAAQAHGSSPSPLLALAVLTDEG